MNDKTLVERLIEFEKFIRGHGALDGSWFGDTRSDFKGAFWWRRFSPIKEAADTIEAQATRIEALKAALPDEIDLFRIIRKAGRSDIVKAKAVYASIQQALESQP